MKVFFFWICKIFFTIKYAGRVKVNVRNKQKKGRSRSLIAIQLRQTNLSRVPPGTKLRQKIQEATLATEDTKKTPLEIRYGKLGNLKDLKIEFYPYTPLL
jgi:hypothetical protein